MGHEELKEVGIKAFGHRHKILKAVKEWVSNLGPGKVFVGLTNFYMVVLQYVVNDHGTKKKQLDLNRLIDYQEWHC